MKRKESTGYFKTMLTFTAVFMLCALLFSIYLSYRTSITAAKSLHLPFFRNRIEISRHIFTDITKNCPVVISL